MTEQYKKQHADIAAYTPNNKALNDKVILVTGAGAGIGRSAAIAFAQHGATVILLGRTLSKLEAVYDEIEQLSGPQPAIFPMNFESATEQDYSALHDAIKEEFGRLDGLLHNAAELGARRPLAQYPNEHFERVMQVNVNAPFALSKAMLPLLELSGSGSIVFTGSGVGIQGRAFWGAYGISKAAIENLMQIFADEYEASTKLRFNSIDPGAVRTQMRATAFPAEDPNSVSAAEDIVKPYIYLMSDESKSLNGMRINAQY